MQNENNEMSDEQRSKLENINVEDLTIEKLKMMSMEQVQELSLESKAIEQRTTGVIQVDIEEYEIDDVPINECCYRFRSFEDANSYLLHDHTQNIYCKYNTICGIIDNDLVDDISKYNFCNSFFKSRHDYLFNIIFPNQVSDVPFSKYGVQSNRTPDAIILSGNLIKIFELSVSSSHERSVLSKGDEEIGVDSKYKQEMLELRRMGFDVIYFPVRAVREDLDDIQYLNKLTDEFGINSIRMFKEAFETWMSLTKIVMRRMSQYVLKIFKLNYSPEVNIKNISPLIVSDSTDMMYHTMSSKFFDHYPDNAKYIKNTLLNIRQQKNTDAYSIKYNDETGFITFNHSGGNLSKSQILTAVDDPIAMLRLIKISSDWTSNEHILEPFVYNQINDKEELLTQEEGHLFKIFVSTISEPLDYKDLAEKCLLAKFKFADSTDPHYLSKYQKKILNSIPTGDMLCKQVLTTTVISRTIDNLVSKFDQMNQESDRYVKPPFQNIIPSAENLIYSGYNIDITPFRDALLKCNLNGNFTKNILKQVKTVGSCLDKEAKLHNDGISSEIRQIYADYHTAIRSINKERKKDGLKNITKADYNDEINELHAKVKMQEKIRRGEIIRKKIVFINVNLKNATVDEDLKNELLHMRKKSVVYNDNRCVPWKSDMKDIQPLLEYLSSNQDPSKWTERICSDLDSASKGIDNPLMMDLKKQLNKCSLDKLDTVKNLKVLHCAEFTSRLCHSLSFYSQCNHTTSQVAVDNLGYKNVILLVRGGKKIFQTKQTKMFKLILPINDTLLPFYNDVNSYEIINIDGSFYLITPWSFMREQQLNTCVFMYHRILTYLLTCTLDTISMFPVLLSFHDRRTTESTLHNLRYIVANTMADMSGIEEILPTFAIKTVDFLQHSIFKSLCANYLQTYMSASIFGQKTDIRADDWLKENPIIHPFLGLPISSLNLLSITIYSTYLMTKAPYNQQVEQAKNFKEIMKTHLYYDGDYLKQAKEYNINVNTNDDYINDLMKNDFNVDLNYCYCLGIYAKTNIRLRKMIPDIERTWDRHCNEPITKIANSRGLRGNDPSDFFSNKGYYIVAKDILQSEHFIKAFEMLNVNDNKSIDLFCNVLLKNSDMSKKFNNDDLCFHVVDKDQRGGGREIYVMDYSTKTRQQGIEKIFGYLCQSEKNEIISVPSSKRTFQIHSSVFSDNRFSSNTDYFMTLDCRKWAPRSNLFKYLYFVNGMQDIFPESFLIHFYNFFDQMLNKRIYTRDSIFQIINKSLSNKGFSNIMECDERGNFFTMPYSFVMGIFNYLSSYLHAINQQYFMDMTIKFIMKEKGYRADIKMLCHSDDSSGKLNCKVEDLEFIVYLLEVNLKSANHMLSTKKSNISRTYYEMVSTLYIARELVPMTPKFFSGNLFKPSDRGYANDVNQCYSRMIEVMSMGGTAVDAWLCGQVLHSCIASFYKVNRVDDVLPTMGGYISTHPHIILVMGSDADLIRIYVNDPLNFSYMLSALHSMNPPSIDDNSIRTVSATPNVNLSKKLKSLVNSFKDPFEADCWAVDNINHNSAPLTVCKWLRKIKTDKLFLASLQDETLTRRISRAIYYRTAACYMTNYGMLNWSDYSNMVNLKYNQEIESDFIDKFRIINSEGILFYKNTDISSYNLEICQSSAPVKPVHLTLNKDIQVLNLRSDPEKLVCSVLALEPQFLYITHDNIKYDTDIIKNRYPDFCDMHPSDLLKITRKMSASLYKDIYMYSRMPTHHRVIKTVNDFFEFLSNNSLNGQKYMNLNIKYKRRDNLITYETSEMHRTLNENDVITPMYIYYLTSRYPVLRHLTYKGDVTLKQLMTDVKDTVKTNQHISRMISLDIQFLDKFIKKIDIKLDFYDKYFHLYLKPQVYINGIWTGAGQVYVNLSQGNYLVVHVFNNRIIKITGNIVKGELSSFDRSYFDFVINYIGFKPLSHFMSKQNKTTISFGLDTTLNYCISNGCNLRSSIEYNYTDNDILSSINFSTGSWEMQSVGIYKLRSIGGQRYHKVTTFPYQYSDVLFNISDYFIKNAANDAILDNLTGEKGDYMNLLIAETLQVDVFINFDDLSANFLNSKLATIMRKFMFDRQLTIDDLPNKVVGNQDSLLYMLCTAPEYSGLYVGQSDITYNISRDLHPNRFVAHIADLKNIDNMDNIKGEEIRSGINELIESIGDEDRMVNKIQQLYQNWGIPGVDTMLSKFNLGSDIDMLKHMQQPKMDKAYASIYNTSIVQALKIMIWIYATIVDDHNLSYGVLTPEMLEKTLCYNAVMDSMNPANRSKTSMSNHLIGHLVSVIFSQERYVQILRDKIHNTVLFNQFPISQNVSELWICAAQSIYYASIILNGNPSMIACFVNYKQILSSNYSMKTIMDTVIETPRKMDVKNFLLNMPMDIQGISLIDDRFGNNYLDISQLDEDEVEDLEMYIDWDDECLKDEIFTSDYIKPKHYKSTAGVVNSIAPSRYASIVACSNFAIYSSKRPFPNARISSLKGKLFYTYHSGRGLNIIRQNGKEFRFANDYTSPMFANVDDNELKKISKERVIRNEVKKQETIINKHTIEGKVASDRIERFASKYGLSGPSRDLLNIKIRDAGTTDDILNKFCQAMTPEAWQEILTQTKNKAKDKLIFTTPNEAYNITHYNIKRVNHILMDEESCPPMASDVKAELSCIDSSMPRLISTGTLYINESCHKMMVRNLKSTARSLTAATKSTEVKSKMMMLDLFKMILKSAILVKNVSNDALWVSISNKIGDLEVDDESHVYNVDYNEEAKGRLIYKIPFFDYNTLSKK